MATFPDIRTPDFARYNALWDPITIAQDRARATILQNEAATGPVRLGLLQNELDTGTQNLSDRATLRGLAGGLARQDMGSIGTALSVPVGVPSVNALSEFGKAQLALGGLPVLPYSTGGGGGPAPAVNQLTPQAPPSDDDERLIDRAGTAEGGNNPAVVNAGGYNGQYQFGAPRLADLKVYTPAPGEIAPGPGGKLVWNGKTEGTFNIPAFPEIKTQADFLGRGSVDPKRAAEAQRAVMHTQVADLRRIISSTPGAENYDPTGLVMVGHLGGPTGMVKFIQSNGAYNPRDSNGTSLQDYYRRFSGNPVAAQQAYGHPDGPLPADHPFHVASNAPTNTATDAGPAAAPSTWSDVQGLVGGYRQQQDGTRVSVDPGYLANRNAPVPGQGMPASQAVAQATSELGDRLNRMDPQAANAAVTARAQELMAGGAPGLRPSAPSPPAPMPQAGPAQPQTAAAPPASPAVAQPASARVPVQTTGMPGQKYGPTLQEWPPGTKPVPDRLGRQYRAPGTPEGMITVQDPDGNQGAVYMPGVLPKVARQQIHHPDGSVSVIDEHGREVLRTEPNSRDVQLKDYERDAKEADTLGNAATQAGVSQTRLAQMMDLAERLKTGANGGTRAQWANLAQTYLPPEWAKRFNPIGEGGAAAAQELEKLATQSAGQQERGVMGARGGIQALNLFKTANPGLELQPEANRTILIAQRIATQADADYANGAVHHFNRNADEFRGGRTYLPLTKYDELWNAQHNPQVYAAAMSAAGGLPWEKWTKDLNMKDPSEVRRVIDVVRKAIPNATVKWKDGSDHSVGVAGNG